MRYFKVFDGSIVDETIMKKVVKIWKGVDGYSDPEAYEKIIKDELSHKGAIVESYDTASAMTAN
jgi:hypothetical protein